MGTLEEKGGTNVTPSKRRRMGRKAFEPGADPMDLQPYKKESWGYKMHLGDWLDGWKEAEEAFNAEQPEKEQPTWGTPEHFGRSYRRGEQT